jgi:hypothetical protein
MKISVYHLKAIAKHFVQDPNESSKSVVAELVM